MTNFDKISNCGKDFDFVINGEIKPISVKELTLNQKSQIAKILEEKIKEVNRKEAIEVSKLLPTEDKMKYLIEVTKTNSKISEKDIDEAAESVLGLVEILKLSTGFKNIDWENVYSENIEQCGRAYFYAVYGKYLEIKEETEVKEIGEASQGDLFR